MAELDASPIQYHKAKDANPAVNQDALNALVSKHMGRFKAWSDWRKPFESTWTDCYSSYMNSRKGSKMPTRSGVVVPSIFQGIETAVPKFLSIIFGQQRFFDILPPTMNGEILEGVAERNRRLLDAQLDMAHFYPKMVEHLKQLCIYGTSYLYTYWKVERKKIVEKTMTRNNVFAGGLPAGQSITWEKQEGYKVTNRRPEIDVIPIEDVYPDPEACDVDEGLGFYIETRINKDALKAMSEGPYPVYANFNQVLEAKGKVEDNDFKKAKESVRGLSDPSQTSSGDPDSIKLLTFWGLEDLDGDGVAEEVCIVIANGKTCVKARSNPWEHCERPLIKQNLYLVTREWYGLGLVQPVVSLKSELDTIRRQNIDSNNLIVNKMWKVNTLADVDLDTLVSTPNGIILTDDMDAVQEVPTNPIPVSPIQMSEMIQRDIENNMAPRSLQGSPESGTLGRTAKGAQLIIGQALEKFGVGAKLIEDVTVRRVLYFFTRLNKQFLDSDAVVSNFYRKFVPELMVEDIQHDLEFQLLGVSDTIQRETVINTMISFVNVYSPLLGPGMNVLKIAKKSWDMLGLSIPANEIFIEQPLLPPPAEGAGVDPNAQVSTGDSTPLAAQVEQNGVSAPPQVPQGGY